MSRLYVITKWTTINKQSKSSSQSVHLKVWELNINYYYVYYQ